MSGISWKAEVGVNHTPAYQVSGRPFATGSVNATTATKVEFPFVTRWIYVVNNGTSDLNVGFSESGVDSTAGGTNFFTIPASTTSAGDGLVSNSQRLELKISEVWLSGSGDVDVCAGLTSIAVDKVSMGTGKPSWSGSVGVG